MVLSPETESSSDDNLMDSETESGDAFEMFSLFEDFKLTIEREKSIDSSRITKKICNNSINDLVSLGMALTNLVITDVEFGFGGKIVLELRLDYKEQNNKSGVSMLRMEQSRGAKDGSLMRSFLHQVLTEGREGFCIFL